MAAEPKPAAKPSSRLSRFEDLVAWQKARVLTRDVYKTTQRGTIAKDWALSSQLQRASVSIMSNLAEGFERTHAREFHQHLNVAKASCAEVRSHLYVALDVGYVDQKGFDSLMTQAEETARIVGGLRASVERKMNTDR
jgi:four helix bundle protein